MMKSEASSVKDWWPWKVCVFLLFATALSYLDRQSLSIVGSLVSKELNLDNAQLGLLLSAFFYTYSGMHLFVGWILDKYNIRVTYTLFVAFWSLSQICSGLVQGFQGLFIARLFLGTFEAAGQTGAARIISRILPGKDRAFANGIMMSGGSLGAMIAGPLMIYLSSTIGWRGGFIVLGLLGIIWSIAWFIWFRPPVEVLKGSSSYTKSLTDADRWNVILSNPKFWACVGGAMFGIPIIHIVNAWVPTYFVQEWGLSLNKDLAIYLFLVTFGLDIGFIIGGGMVSYLIRRSFSVEHARKAVLVVAGCLMLSIGAVPFSRSIPIAILLIFLLNVGRAAFGAIFLAFNQDIAPGRVGMIAGIMGAIGAFFGALMVWLIGIISKHQGFKVPFIILAGMSILGLIPLLIVKWESHSTDLSTGVTNEPVSQTT
jgi:sugar phosphate permease